MRHILISIFLLPIIALSQTDFSKHPDTISKHINTFEQIQYVDIDERDYEIPQQLNKIKNRFIKNFTNEIVFSHQSGFYTDTFHLVLYSVNSVSDNIHYTLDGSVPTITSPI